MEIRRTICPCCGKEVDLPIHEFAEEADCNYTTVMNSKEDFFDLVDQCPECGYVELFDNGVSKEMQAFTASNAYREILENPDLEPGLKKWILLGLLSESDENYTEAGIAYTKAYDYLELKNLPLDKRLILKAASCFLSAADAYTSFQDAFFAVDCFRRDGDFEKAKELLQTICENFSGELVDEAAWKEKLWLDTADVSKRYFEL